MHSSRRLVVAAAVVWLAAPSARPTTLPGGQMATADRVQGPEWWPTQSSTSRRDYVGVAACATCHPRQAATQRSTAMARTAAPADRSEVLRPGATLTFDRNGYHYEITATAADRIYSVSGGGSFSSVPLTWAFGEGRVGQSFLFERDGLFREARVSYYEATHALDFTPARALEEPRTLEEAMSRPIGAAEIRRCFACHTTASATDGGFDAAAATPGITCEACHGPGRRHAEATDVQRRANGRGGILNPARLDPADAIDFCGACHATFWDVKLANERGIAALRSQPYRLQSSRCWTATKGGDARLACTACHNPHVPLVRDPVAYDSKCRSCHAGRGGEATTAGSRLSCPVSSERCTSCHMPKYDVPGMHHAFTDHQIRVAQRP